jgi:hypothetical protein
MQRKICLIAIMAVVVLMAGCAETVLSEPSKTTIPEPSWSPTSTGEFTPSPSSQVWSLEGRFVDFTSICDLETGPLPPSKHVKQSGKWIFTGCKNLDMSLQEPVAIIITIRNSSETSSNLSVPMLSDVVVNTGKTSETALAFWRPGFWDQPGWVNEMEGATLEIELEPGVELDLLYLLPRFSGQVTIKVADIGSLNL